MLLREGGLALDYTNTTRLHAGEPAHAERRLLYIVAIAQKDKLMTQVRASLRTSITRADAKARRAVRALPALPAQRIIFENQNLRRIPQWLHITRTTASGSG